MSAVVVTGAGGFVGSAIVRRLVQVRPLLWDGKPLERVVALLRPGGSAARLAELSGHEGWSIEQIDVYNRAELRELLRRVRPRAVLNTALDADVFSGAPVSHEPLESLFLELGELTDDARLVHAGSAWVLAPGIGLDEGALLEPRSPYALHKAREDELLAEFGDACGVRWIGLRLFNIFGRYEKPSRLLPYLVTQLSRGEAAEVSHGDQLRDFNDVDDIAGAFVLALAAAEEGAWDALYHIGSGRATTVRDFVLSVASLVGDPAQIRFGAGRTPDQELAALVADPSRAERVLGWKPEQRLEERLQAAIDWWLARLSSPVSDRPPREEALR